MSKMQFTPHEQKPKNGSAKKSDKKPISEKPPVKPKEAENND